MERFWSKVDKTGKCWLWKASTLRGRPTFWIDGRTRRAAQVAYEWEYGPLGEGLELFDECRNSLCVRPSHHYPGTALQRLQKAARARNYKYTAGIIFALMHYQWPKCQWEECGEEIAKVQAGRILPLCQSHLRRYKDAAKHREYQRSRLIKEFAA